MAATMDVTWKANVRMWRNYDNFAAPCVLLRCIKGTLHGTSSSRGKNGRVEFKLYDAKTGLNAC